MAARKILEQKTQLIISERDAEIKKVSKGYDARVETLRKKGVIDGVTDGVSKNTINTANDAYVTQFLIAGIKWRVTNGLQLPNLSRGYVFPGQYSKTLSLSSPIALFDLVNWAKREGIEVLHSVDRNRNLFVAVIDGFKVIDGAAPTTLGGISLLNKLKRPARRSINDDHYDKIVTDLCATHVMAIVFANLAIGITSGAITMPDAVYTTHDLVRKVSTAVRENFLKEGLDIEFTQGSKIYTFAFKCRD